MSVRLLIGLERDCANLIYSHVHRSLLLFPPTRPHRRVTDRPTTLAKVLQTTTWVVWKRWLLLPPAKTRPTDDRRSVEAWPDEPHALLTLRMLSFTEPPQSDLSDLSIFATGFERFLEE